MERIKRRAHRQTIDLKEFGRGPDRAVSNVKKIHGEEVPRQRNRTESTANGSVAG
jgi:hypothetical protein